MGAQCANFVAGLRLVPRIAVGRAQRQGQALAATVFAGGLHFDAVIPRRARAACVVQAIPLHAVVAGLARGPSNAMHGGFVVAAILAGPLRQRLQIARAVAKHQ